MKKTAKNRKISTKTNSKSKETKNHYKKNHKKILTKNKENDERSWRRKKDERIVVDFYHFFDLNYTPKFTRKELGKFIGRVRRKWLGNEEKMSIEKKKKVILS